MTQFVKMHGLGNDFVILDARGNADLRVGPPAARAIADRRHGIGCDQILILRDAADADFFMEILNSDGSRAQACGNGTRCVAAMVMRETDRESLQINTDGGVLTAWHGENGLVSVDMGPVQMGWQEVPLAREMDTVAVELAAAPGPAVCHSMGNPHAVVFVDDVEAVDLERIGPAIEHDDLFPDRVNLSIVHRQEEDLFRVRVWERGAGITLACGSGACAVGVAIARRGLGGRKNGIMMDGGLITIDWQDDGSVGGRVVMTGPVAYACHGVMEGALAQALEAANG
jgi:diaminopimelate epimerase